MSQLTPTPLYKLYVEAWGEPYYHLPQAMTFREATVVAQRIGTNGFVTPADENGDVLYIPAHRIKKVGIIHQQE